MAGSVLGVHRAFQYGSGQIQSIVAKAVVRRLHIKDVLEYIRDELPVPTDSISGKYTTTKASKF